MSAPLIAARPRRPTRLAWTLATVLLLGACASPSASPTGGNGTGGDGDVGGSTVTISGRAFSPASITVAAGETIIITNNDSGEHRIVEGENGTEVADPSFVPIPLPGAPSTTSVVFDAPGTYHLTCTIHPSMNMTVTVE